MGAGLRAKPIFRRRGQLWPLTKVGLVTETATQHFHNPRNEHFACTGTVSLSTPALRALYMKTEVILGRFA